jgi:hypothetical protein
LEDSISLQALPGKPYAFRQNLENGYAYSIIKVNNLLLAGWFLIRTPSWWARYGGKRAILVSIVHGVHDARFRERAAQFD